MRNLVVVFVDFSSAFDSVFWQRLEEALSSLGVPGVLVTAILSAYRGAVTVVRTGAGLTEWFRIWLASSKGTRSRRTSSSSSWT